MTGRIEKQPPAHAARPMILDMGLGSREQYFPLQKPDPKLILVD